jgi:hypothetical protein
MSTQDYSGSQSIDWIGNIDKKNEVIDQVDIFGSLNLRATGSIGRPLLKGCRQCQWWLNREGIFCNPIVGCKLKRLQRNAELTRNRNQTD